MDLFPGAMALSNGLVCCSHRDRLREDRLRDRLLKPDLLTGHVVNEDCAMLKRPHPTLLGIALAAKSAVRMKSLARQELPDVEATVKIVRLSAFDLKARTVNVDFVLMLDWIDPRLIGLDADEIIWKNTFQPKVVIHNAATEMTADNREPRLFDSTKGWVRLSARYRGTILVDSVDLSEYPFDRQIVRIQLKPLKVGNLTFQLKGPNLRKVESAYSDGHVFDDAVSQLEEWEVVDKLEGQPCRERYDISITMKRRCDVALWNIFFPLFLLNALSFVSFAVNTEDIPGRLQITLMLLLTVITFRMSIGDGLPVHVCLTDLDKYFMCSVFVPFTNAAEHVVASILVRRGYSTFSVDLFENMWVLAQVACCVSVHAWLCAKWRRVGRVMHTEPLLSRRPSFHRGASDSE